MGARTAALCADRPGGVSPAVYREIEAGTRSPDFETWNRICALYGWPQTFVGGAAPRFSS